jgi:2-succinyl-6-hydroxy-2,4-cyclohexadiene-1-carboxylate synthase
VGTDLEKIAPKIKIICLHGFLGLPADWDLVKSYFMVSPLAHQFEWWNVDYMTTPGLDPSNDFASWARNFNLKIRQRFPEGPRVLVGYSLGGRLALHALQADASLYEKAVFVSANPGLQREKDKEDRAQSDLIWSQKFLEMPWQALMKEWGSQAVFKDSLSEPQRQEAAYNRSLLAQSLLQWSLSQQGDFREFISQQSEKILWVAGEKDIKFASITMDLKKRSPGMESLLLAKASHRVLFDQPYELAQAMIQFLD